MKNYISIGVMVSRGSVMFPLVRMAELQPDMRAYKLWESNIHDNIFKNDVIVQDEEPEDMARASINSFFNQGGIVFQMFSLDDEVDFEYVLQNGEVKDEKFSSILEGIDMEQVIGGGDGLDVKLVDDEGLFVSFSRNILSGEILEGIAGEEIFHDDTVGGEASSDTGGGDDDGEAKADAITGGSAAENLKLFFNMVRYFHGVAKERQEEAEAERHGPPTEVALVINGRATWLGSSTLHVKDIAIAVLDHLGLGELGQQLEREPGFRAIPPELVSQFPAIIYYHQAFPNDEDPASAKENEEAARMLEEAKRIHAIIRTERDWEFNVVPMLLQELVDHHESETSIKKIYLLPPKIIGSRSPKVNLKMVQKCLLEPMAKGDLSLFIVNSGADGKPTITPVDTSGVKDRVPDPSKDLVLIYGPELVKSLGQSTIPGFLERTREEHGGDDCKKILVHVYVDAERLQQEVKDLSFKMKKVEEQSLKRLERQRTRVQDRLHVFSHVEKNLSAFEEAGFDIIEIGDNRAIEQDVKLFIIDQVMPYVYSKNVSRVTVLMPRDTELFLASLLRPLVPGGGIDRLRVSGG